jgi:tetratricopeptide (TPR) repeat protein
MSVFWVHASNIDRFRQSYASIAEKFNIPGHDDPEADVLLLVSNWLEQQTMMRWLMIIDNADDMDMFFSNKLKQDDPDEGSQTTAALISGNLARYIPDCNHGSILITTRDKKVGVRICQGLSPIEINKMTDDEAHQLVQRIISTQKISMKETVRLLSKLEHLPLALAQAASFIQENDISIDDYVQLLDESDSAFIDQLSESFETVGRDSETPHAVTATWIISFEQIRRKEPFISDILSFLSFFHFQAIPRVFVEDCYQQRYQEQAEGGTLTTAVLIKALGTLKAFSFISEAGDKSLTMHRLVQLVTQKWVVNEGQADEFANSAMKIMSDKFPPEKFNQFNIREICMRYLPHANSVLAKNRIGLDNDLYVASLLGRLLGYFLFKGEKDKAEELGLQATAMFKRALGEDHEYTIRCMGNLAEVYRRQSRYQEAEVLGMQSLEKYKAVLGEEDPNTLRIMGNLALTYREQGRWQESEVLQKQANETFKRVMGEDHPDTLNSLMSLALLSQCQGRLGEAEALLVGILERSKTVLGVEHHITMCCMSNLAMVYGRQNRLKEAENLGIQAMEIKKRLLGEEHPDTLTNISNLAHTYYDQGLLEKAEDLGVRLIEVERRVLGEDHEITLISSSNLISVYRGQNRWKEAEDLALRTLEAGKTKLGKEPPHTKVMLVVMNDLALIYQHRHRWQEAEALGRRALELSAELFGQDHHTTLAILGNLSIALEGLGRLSEAIALMADCVVGLERTKGRDDPDTKVHAEILEGWRKRAEGSFVIVARTI